MLLGLLGLLAACGEARMRGTPEPTPDATREMEASDGSAAARDAEGSATAEPETTEREPPTADAGAAGTEVEPEAEPEPIPDGPRVEVDAIGRLVAFHHADGTLIARKQDALSHPLPTGAFVTLAEDDLITFVGVEAPATIAMPDPLPQPQPPLQAIAFEVEPMDPALSYFYETGCRWGTVEPGENVVEIGAGCVDGAGAELIVRAADGEALVEYAIAKDIDVFGPADEIVHVELPAWRAPVPGGSFTLTGVPAEGHATIGVTALRGRIPMLATGHGWIDWDSPQVEWQPQNLIVDIGTRWLLHHGIDESVPGRRVAETLQIEDVGHPLAFGATLDLGALLPIPELTVDLGGSPQVRWSPSGAELSLSQITIVLRWDVEGDYRRWAILLPPGPASLELPTLPDFLRPAPLEHVETIELRFAQHDDRDASPDAVRARGFHEAWAAPHQRRPGRMASRMWVRP